MTDIVKADLSLPNHADAVIQLMDAYALAPMGGGKGLSRFVKENLPAELAKRESAHVILAFVDAQLSLNYFDLQAEVSLPPEILDTEYFTVLVRIDIIKH